MRTAYFSSRRQPGVVNARFRSGDGIDISARERGDAGEPADEIEHDPFGGEQAPRRSREQR
jgi:hypothetical protein